MILVALGGVNVNKVKLITYIILCIFLFSLSNISFAQNNKQSPKKFQSDVNLPILVKASNGPNGVVTYPKELIDGKFAGDPVPIATPGCFYPSIYFLISAKPRIYYSQETKGDHTDVDFENLGQDLDWLEVIVNVTPANKVRILALAPDETKSFVQESAPTSIAKVGEELSQTLTPFFPTGQTDEIQAAAKGARVLFQYLFPPKVKASQYAFLTQESGFGWYLRKAKDAQNINSNSDSIKSLLGIHKGIVFLQVDKDVSEIVLTYKIIAKFNKNEGASGSDDEYIDFSQTEKLKLFQNEPQN